MLTLCLQLAVELPCQTNLLLPHQQYLKAALTSSSVNSVQSFLVLTEEEFDCADTQER